MKNFNVKDLLCSVQAPVTKYVVLSVDAPRDLPARIVDTDADVTMSLGK